jgi:hypothetical protein
MRPSIDVKACELYECPRCGTRYDEPEGRYCENCEGTLRCLDNSRDL